MTLTSARRFALTLPQTTEQPHFDSASFHVNKKIFATVPAGGKYLHIFLDQFAIRAAVIQDRNAFEELYWGKKLTGIRVNLPQADEKIVFELLQQGWQRQAPKRLINQPAK